MATSYKNAIERFIVEFSKSHNLDPKKVWRDLMHLKRRNKKRLRIVPQERLHEFDRKFDNLVNPIEPGLMQPAQANNKRHTDYKLVKKPRFMPQIKLLKKPELRLDSKLIYQYYLNHKPVIRVDKKVIAVSEMDAHNLLAQAESALNPEFNQEANRAQANMNLLGQNPLGATSNSTKFATLQHETAGEVQKSLGIGQQDRLELKAEMRDQAMRESENRAGTRVHSQALRAEARHAQMESGGLALENTLAIDESLRERRMQQQQFESQYFQAKVNSNKLVDDMDDVLFDLEDEMRRVVQSSRLAAPAA